MVKNVMGLKFLVFLGFLAIIAGCSNKDDEVKALKEELAQTQDELNTWKERNQAMSIELRDSKASQRDLGTQLTSADDVSKTIEERLQIYSRQITNLQTQIQQLNSTITEQQNIITEQQAIIDDQEAALQELLDSTTGTGTNVQTPYY